MPRRMQAHSDDEDGLYDSDYSDYESDRSSSQSRASTRSSRGSEARPHRATLGGIREASASVRCIPMDFTWVGRNPRGGSLSTPEITEMNDQLSKPPTRLSGTGSRGEQSQMTSHDSGPPPRRRVVRQPPSRKSSPRQPPTETSTRPPSTASSEQRPPVRFNAPPTPSSMLSRPGTSNLPRTSTTPTGTGSTNRNTRRPNVRSSARPSSNADTGMDWKKQLLYGATATALVGGALWAGGHPTEASALYEGAKSYGSTAAGDLGVYGQSAYETGLKHASSAASTAFEGARSYADNASSYASSLAKGAKDWWSAAPSTGAWGTASNVARDMLITRAIASGVNVVASTANSLMQKCNDGGSQAAGTRSTG